MRFKIEWAPLILVLLSGACAAEQAIQRQDPPMVVSYSWSSPDTRYLKLHADEWEELPFTGTMVHVSWPQPEAGSAEACSGKGTLSWAPFRKTRFTDEMLVGPLKDLKETDLAARQDNFLLAISYLGGGYFDWYDDAWWETVLHNIEALARLTREADLRGMFLDCEEYGCPFWSWGGSRPDYALKNREVYKDKTWEQTRRQVRQRGRSLIQAINKGYPGITIWTLYGYSHVEMKEGATDLSDAGNGLYAAFLDGMLEASDDQTIFIDGCEGSYRFSEVEQFEGLRKRVTETALKYTMVPESYRKKIRVGFGLYVDMYNYKNSHPWYSDRPQDNYMTPQHLKKAVKNALAVGDGYVWIYSEYPSWWLDSAEDTLGEGVRSRDDHKWIDRAYWRAIEQALPKKLRNSRTTEKK